MFYIFCFAISTCCFILGETTKKLIRISNIKKIHLQKILDGMGICVLTLPASFRAKEIGTDVMVYVYYAFERMKTKTSIIEVLRESVLEPFYELLCYVSYKLFPDLHMLHFLTSIIIICCVYVFVNYFRNKISVSMAILCFMLLYYNNSLNVVRQYIAIGISLLAMKEALKGDLKKHITLCLIAVLFHSSAIISFVYYPISIYLLNTNKPKRRVLIVMIAVGLALLGLKSTVNFLVGIGIFPQQYAGYFNLEGESSILMQILSRFTIILCGFLFYKEMHEYDRRNDFLFCMLLIDLVIGLLTPYIGPGARFSLFFGVVQCVYIPELCKVISNRVKHTGRIAVIFAFVIYLFIYWTYCIPIRNFGDTFPYISDIFAWL